MDFNLCETEKINSKTTIATQKREYNNNERDRNHNLDHFCLTLRTTHIQ